MKQRAIKLFMHNNNNNNDIIIIITIATVITITINSMVYSDPVLIIK